jgi:hypothetical protein
VSTVVCGSSNPSSFVDASTCITGAQAVTLESVYQNWTSVEGGWLFPSYVPGSEPEWDVMLGETPFQLARKCIVDDEKGITVLMFRAKPIISCTKCTTTHPYSEL